MCDLLNTNAVPCTATKRDIELIDVVEVRITFEPALGAELVRVVENVWVEQNMSE